MSLSLEMPSPGNASLLLPTKDKALLLQFPHKAPGLNSANNLGTRFPSEREHTITPAFEKVELDICLELHLK